LSPYLSSIFVPLLPPTFHRISLNFSFLSYLSDLSSNSHFALNLTSYSSVPIFYQRTVPLLIFHPRAQLHVCHPKAATPLVIHRRAALLSISHMRAAFPSIFYLETPVFQSFI
jgi:hypothetical protein